MHNFETLVMIGGYAILLVLIGIYLSIKENKQDFIIGSRNIGIIPTSASMAASFRDGGGIAFWISMGLAGGYGGMWLFVGFAIASAFMMIYSSKLRNAAEKANHLTINETVESRIGKVSAHLTTIVTLAFSFCLIALQFFVSGGILSTILEQPKWVGTSVVSILLIIYMTLGGYKSVIYTDTIQFFCIISLISAPFFIHMNPADYTNLESLISYPNADKFAMVIFGMFFFLSMPEAWQRIYSAKDTRTIQLALPITNIFLVIMTISLVWMGMSLRALPAETIASYAEPYLAIFDPSLGVSSWFLGYVIMVFLAITMSTQSSACYTFTSTINRIFFHRKKEVSDDEYIKTTRWQTTILLLLTALLSLSFSNVIKTLFDILSFFICLAPVYMLAVINPRWLKDWKIKDELMAFFTIFGIITFIIIFFLGITKESFLLSTMPAVMTSVFVFISSLYAQRKNDL